MERSSERLRTRGAVPATAIAKFASPETYTPKHLAERIPTSKATLEGERKQVTVLFADLPPTSIRFCGAPNRAICLCSSPPNSTWPLTSKPPRRSA